LDNPTAVIVSSAGLFDGEVMEVAMYQDVCIFDWLVAMRLITPPLHNAVRSAGLVSMH
jgi:hypothetical protein